ncbi:tol-pal system protein YbgF [Microvirga thermotolerans]|uniref:Cell division coordinator CpoB n=1 Tax=Microvirga thermotolerans TaxID=2651334 RepID=A0A5P9JUM1_9HYPH|nr:tol-pal system protein YbgF [Microvirga thermotolerans]QFU15478.1 tol-pal system protein YbgF [Microvirga thermotolerans]
MLRRLIALFAFVTALAGPAAAQDAAEAIVRLNRLENQFRQMSGQLEQLQHENQVVKEQLRRFQEDVEYRFQEGRGGKAPPAATPSRPAPAPAQPQRRSDVFDPSEAPGAPGAPRPLGTTPPSAPLTADAGQPLPLPGNRGAQVPGQQLSGIGELIEEEEGAMDAAPLDINPSGRTAAIPSTVPVPRGPSVAATSIGDPRADFETAYGYFAQQRYDDAEMAFRRFLQSNPRDKLVPEAAYWLGETYLQRNRYREAAEQFLNVSTEHPNAARAPEALLKLGVSLNGLGARDRACAVFAELDRKYPQASAAVRQASEREQRRSKCG